MRTCRLGEGTLVYQARRLLERVINRLVTGPVILMYHRVADVAVDPWSNAVSPRHFDEHLQVVRRRYRPMPLTEMAALHRERRLPPNAVGISFDDGYADNLHDARPLCVRHDVPATVFVTAGMVGAAREFYWDELERVLLGPGTVPRELALRFGGREHRWSLGEDAVYRAESFERHRGFRVGDATPTRRHALYVELCSRLVRLSSAERESVLEAIRAWARVPASDRKLAHPMTADEVRSLVDGGLIEVGAHSATHQALPTLPPQEVAREIEHSKCRLEEIVDDRVVAFAYPHGQYDERSANTLRSSGFAYACSTVNRAIRPSADLYAMPRVFVKDWNGEQFAKRLARHVSVAG